MAQQKPERAKIDEMLRIVDQLTPEEHDKLDEEMKLQWLRRALDEGEESLRLHGGIPAEEVFKRLRERNAQFREKGNE
jgi:hypothetical protein